jgi:ABC-type uncharacterized transport system involved in gliding motility auxiliary subunit
MKNITKIFSGKKMKYGINSAVMTAAFIAILIVINLIVGQYPLKKDLTKNRLFSFAPQTIEILENLDQTINIYALYPQGQEDPFMKEILERYARSSDKIKLEFVDPVKNPTFVNQFADENTGIQQGAVIFAGEGNKRFKIVNYMDMLDYNYETQTFDSIKAEQRFTNAIVFVTAEKMPVVYFTQGHSEQEFAAAKQVLERENFQFKNINLYSEEIPEDAELIIVASPQRDFAASEIEKMDQFFDKGGRAAFLFDISSNELPTLEAYLKEWGVGLNKDVIIEESKNNYSMSQTMLIPNIQSHEITGTLKSNNLLMLVPVARSLDILFEEKDGITVNSLLKTTDKSWGETNFKEAKKGPEDMQGPLDIAVAIERENAGEEAKATKILVMGNAQFLADQYMSSAGIANVDFFMNSVNWAQDKKESITIRPKSLEGESIAFTSQIQILLYVALVVVVIPLAVFIFGGVVWMRRRHL